MSAVPRITLAEKQPESESFSIGAVAAGGAAKFPLASGAVEEEQALQSKALDIATQAKTLVVRDPLTFKKAGDFLRLVKSMSSEITTFFSPLKKKANEAHKALTAAEQEKLAPLAEAEAHLKRGMAVYKEEEERKRREEEKRLQEEANRKAEEERLDLAIEAEKAGDKESAEELLAAPVEAPIVVVKSETKVAGVSFRDNWKSRVVDIKALARGVVDGTVPTMAILPNQAFLDNQAKASKGEIKYPGVQTYSEKVVSAGRG